MLGRLTAAMLFLSCALAASSALGQPPLPPEEAWLKIKVGPEEAYCMPDDVARQLGLDRRNIPDEKNAATYYIEAINEWTPFGGGDDVYLEAIARPWNPKEFPELAEWLRNNEPAFTLIEKAASLDECQFPILMGSPGATQLAAVLLPYLSAMRDFNRGLIVRAHLYEAQGKQPEALQNYLTALRMSSHLGQQQFLIDGLVSIAMGSDALRRLCDWMMWGKMSPEQMRATRDGLLTASGRLPDPAQSFEGEKAMGMNVIDTLMHMDFGALGIGRMAPEGPVCAFFAGRAWRVIMPDRTMKRDFAQYYDAQVALARLIDFAPGGALNAPLRAKPWNVLASFLLPALSRAIEEYQRERAVLYGAALVAALQLCRAEHGAYPETLDDLVPDYLLSLAPDPFTGGRYAYIPLGDSFMLYSLGPNGWDDWGTPRDWQPGSDKDDIVLTIPMMAR